MKRIIVVSLGFALALTLNLVALSFPEFSAAQEKPQVPNSDAVRKSIKPVRYEMGAGSTKVVLIAAPSAPNASGEAKVDAKKGRTDIDAKV